jgi:hypothetical protein
MVHAGLSVSTLEWICHVIRPARSDFEGFHATLRVQTFDDIDICMKIAATALTMSPISVIGLRELVVNAVEHGNQLRRKNRTTRQRRIAGRDRTPSR